MTKTINMRIYLWQDGHVTYATHQPKAPMHGAVMVIEVKDGKVAVLKDQRLLHPIVTKMSQVGEVRKHEGVKLEDGFEPEQPERMTPERETEIRTALAETEPKERDTADNTIAELLAEMDEMQNDLKSMSEASAKQAYEQGRTMAEGFADRLKEMGIRTEAG